MKITGQRRKAISPIVATVLIIAAVLIAFAFLATYVFGILGGSSTKAVLTISAATSIAHTAVASFSATFINTGTANTQITSGTLVYGGATCTLTVPSTQLTAGSTTTLTITSSSCGTPVTGEAYTLTVVISDGTPIAYQSSFT